MLPNHAPLVIAEQFGTLESLYPGRIDLGLGRAPGSDPVTAHALRRNLGSSGDTFPRDLLELMAFFRKAAPGQTVRAVPGEGLNVPIWLLGSSDFSAGLAAELGLPFAFASHFAPDELHAALMLYRRNFKPSEWLAGFRAMVGVGAVAAAADAEAKPPLFVGAAAVPQLDLRCAGPITAAGRQHGRQCGTPPNARSSSRRTRVSAVGSPATGSSATGKPLLEETSADELILTGHVYEHAARLRSFELASEVMHAINEARGSS